MKVTITFKDSEQIAEDSWRTFTRVIHVSEDDTIKELKKRYFEDQDIIDVELHIQDGDCQTLKT